MASHNRITPKIEIWTHVIGNTQETMRMAHQLLWRLSNRCLDNATDMEDSPEEKKAAQLSESKEMLYELAHTLQFVCNTLERDEEILEECRIKGIADVASPHESSAT